MIIEYLYYLKKKINENGANDTAHIIEANDRIIAELKYCLNIQHNLHRAHNKKLDPYPGSCSAHASAQHGGTDGSKQVTDMINAVAQSNKVLNEISTEFTIIADITTDLVKFLGELATKTKDTNIIKIQNQINDIITILNKYVI